VAAGWSSQDDEEVGAAARRALKLRASWIDTAAFYGLRHSEEILNRALEGVSERP
jgi:aryl-alcohol dehydrogenase-like predicted oxidoreductase